MAPPLPVPPDWLLACATCAEALAVYRDRVAAAEPAGTLRALETLTGHLVAVHLGRLPSYIEGCPNCAEWRMLAPDIGEERPGSVPAVAEGDLRHRAAHLVAPTLTG
ncbi:hypothetical protein ACQP1W_52435 (plasmid) [Spirillospora sp. CA-255316]